MTPPVSSMRGQPSLLYPEGAIAVPSLWRYLASSHGEIRAGAGRLDVGDDDAPQLLHRSAFKFVCLIPKPARINVDVFRRHLLETHAALVASVASILRVQRYVQTHVVQSAAIDGMIAQRGWAANPYTEMTEIWWRSEQDMIEAMQSEEGQRAGRMLAEDEVKITDRNVIVWAGQEHELILPETRLQ